MIKIDTFKPEYLERQVELGQQIVSQWLGGQQTPLERLKEVYTGDDFNPEEKFYAIDQDNENKVVGFLTSSIKTNEDGAKIVRMELPILDNSLNKELGDKLIEEAINYFRKEKVTKIITRASTAWGDTIYYTKKYNFEHDRLLWKAGRLNISDYSFQSEDQDTETVEIEKDEEEIIRIFLDYHDMDKKKGKNKVDRLSSISDRIISWRKIVDSNKIVALSELVQNKYDAKNAHMYSIYTSSNFAEKYRDQIMDDHVKLSREQNIEIIDNFFEPPLIEESAHFQKYGFDIHNVSFYERSL